MPKNDDYKGSPESVKKPQAKSDSWKQAREGFTEEDCFERGYKPIPVSQ